MSSTWVVFVWVMCFTRLYCISKYWNLLQLAICRLIETTCSQPVDNKFWQSTCSMSVDNLQQTCPYQTVTSRANASWYRLVDNKLLQDVNSLVAACVFFAVKACTLLLRLKLLLLCRERSTKSKNEVKKSADEQDGVQPPTPTTPEVVSVLSEEKREEYKKLKLQLALKEQRKGQTVNRKENANEGSMATKRNDHGAAKQAQEGENKTRSRQVSIKTTTEQGRRQEQYKKGKQLKEKQVHQKQVETNGPAQGRSYTIFGSLSKSVRDLRLTFAANGQSQIPCLRLKQNHWLSNILPKRFIEVIENAAHRRLVSLVKPLSLGSPLIDGIFLVQKMCIYSCVTLSARGPVQCAVSLWCINVYIMYIYLLCIYIYYLGKYIYTMQTLMHHKLTAHWTGPRASIKL